MIQTSATCIYFEESDVVVIFEDHDDSEVVEVVDQSSNNLDIDANVREETPKSPISTRPAFVTLSPRTRSTQVLGSFDKEAS